MSEVLTAEKRELKFSKGELNKFRGNGKIPAVIFGKGIESKPVFVDLLEFRNTFQKNGKIFEIKIDGKTELVNTKLIDKTVFGKVHHINFLVLKRGEKTSINVPLTVEGEAAGKKEGGIVQLLMDKIELYGVPKDMPDGLKIDITDLNIGDTLTASDIKLPKGIEIREEADQAIVTCSAPKQQAEETPEVEGTVVEGEQASEAETPAETETENKESSES